MGQNGSRNLDEATTLMLKSSIFCDTLNNEFQLAISVCKTNPINSVFHKMSFFSWVKRMNRNKEIN